MESSRHQIGRAPRLEGQTGGTGRDSGATRLSRILVVEDQADVRMMLVTVLQMEGFTVDQACTAHDGLQRLEESSYDLVLSDYAMPGGTGTWMLEEAARRGRLDHTPALILTAHPGVADLGDIEVVTKPLDLDRFVDQVRTLLAAPAQHDPEAGASATPAQDQRSAPAYKVELVLYVSSASPSSLQAQHNFERVLAAFDARQVKYRICDLGSDPAAGDADRIAFTPTLVKRFPEPRMWVLGNLREPQILADLLRVYGVDNIE